MSFETPNPFLYQLREGSLADPYVDKVETLKPVDSRVVLSELPVKQNGVIVDGLIETDSNNLSENQFFVDYTNGSIYLNPSRTSSITIRYKGRGFIQIPGERVFTKRKNQYMTLDKTVEELDLSISTISKTSDANNIASVSRDETIVSDYNSKLGSQNLRIDNLKNEISNDVFNKIINDNKATYKTPVANYDSILTSYPQPENGWEVQTLDDGKIYRRINNVWTYIMQLTPTPIASLNDSISKIISNQDYTLPKTIAKLSGLGRKPKIGIMGDSLAEPAGTGTPWTYLLFDPSYRSQGFYLGDIFGDTNIPTLSEVDNYAVGGQTSHFSMAYIAPEKRVIKPGAYINQSVDGDALYLPPIFQKKYDLMIISYGTNGGEFSECFLENLIRQLRLTGTEVMLLTSNPRSDNPNFGFGTLYKQIAKLYSSSVADTQAYFKQAISSGVSISTLLSDTVHSASEGHKLYAKAICDTLRINRDHYNQGKHPSNFITERRINVPKVQGWPSILFPSNPFVQFIPTATTGTGVSAAQGNNLKSPIYGRYDDLTTKLTKLEVGQYADFTCTQFRGVGIIFYSATPATVELSLQNGNLAFETINLNTLTYRAEYRHVELSKLGFDDFQNRTVRVKCTSGTANILGMVFYSTGHKQTRAILKNGTWTNGTQWGTATHCTNTANDTFEFDVEGNGFNVDVYNHNASGIVDVFVDGLKMSTIDLYTTLDDNVYQIRKNDLAYGKHKVKIVLTPSTNANVIAPTATKQRLCILDTVASVYGEDFNVSKHI